MSGARAKPGAVTWRDATPGDAAALAALGRESFAETFGHLYAPADLAAFLATHTVERWRAEIADAAYAVRLGEADGRVIAYCKLGPPILPVERPRPTIELRQLYVLRPWQGGGAAHAAMDWAIATARARGAADLALSVFVDNERARRFYRRYGFERVGTYAFKVGAHEDEDDIMRLAL
ncbi:GNAT family N-acetyltransferase [Sphingomonas sp.]|uniref:GNAT family N-acetyltransferase n=1 Tax=Sphingomonas sp. TaxID=28214 RepID=UPI003AFFDEB5